MIALLIWWLAAVLLGLAAFPVAFSLFPRLHDRGYSLSKALAILVVGYTVWLLGGAGVPFLRTTVVLVTAALVLGGAYMGYRQRQALRDFVAAERPALLALEGVFLLAFAFWGFFRLYDPHISGTEKPMDFGFLNAALRSERFPPNDMWLSGHSISYYYFGYLLIAVVTRLLGTPSAEAYNLGLTLVPALVASGACGIVYSLVRGSGGSLRRGLIFGVVGAVLFIGISNLEGALEFLRARGLGATAFWGWIGIKGLDGPAAQPSWVPHDFWWWWRGTRLIDTVVDGRSLDYTITEFPYFSFMLGDLHPHVVALPFGLLVIGFALNLLRGGAVAGDGPFTAGGLAQRPLAFLAMALAIGSLGFINSWDLPAYGAVFAAAAFLYGHLLYHERGAALSKGRGWAILRTAGGVALTFVIAVVLYLPFYLQFSSQAAGILPLRGPGTRFLHYALFWGILLFLGASFLFRRAWETWSARPPAWRELRVPVLAAAGLFLAWVPVEFVLSVLESRTNEEIWGAIFSRFGTVLPLVVLLAVGLFALLRLLAQRERRDDLFALALVTGGFALTLAPELFYLKDFFGSRMNTVFKVYYQAWALLAIGSAYVLHILTAPGGLRSPYAWWAWVGGAFFLLAASLYYPSMAIGDKTNGFRGPPTLDGLAFVREREQAEYDAIAWLQREVQGAPVVLEAVGDDYSDFGRISGRTGLPTLLGWPGHELQWRGSSALMTGRREAVEEIYKTQDMRRAQELLRKYNVEYVYVGPLERRAYGTAGIPKFEVFTKKVWEKGDVIIYQVRKS